MFILGYYYDNETNLYYLQSRYYDPQTHRFINIDSIEYLDPENINGLNLFAYCGNNPVVRVDYNGNAWWDWLLGAVIGSIAGGIIGGKIFDSIKFSKIAKQGILIGKKGNFEVEAMSRGLAYYDGLKGYKLIEKNFT